MGEGLLADVSHGVVTWTEMPHFLSEDRLVTGTTRAKIHVYERWRARPKNGSMNWIQGNELIPSQVIGMIRMGAWQQGAKVGFYGPDQKDVALASMPDWFRAYMDECHEQHDQDALMHLWLYYFDNWFDGEEIEHD